jgi:hypothetical protein
MSSDLAVVTYLYKGKGGYTAEHANVLRRMVARNLKAPHRFFVVGDDPAGLDPETTFIPCRRELLPLGGCYVRLDLWRRDAAETFGERILLLDLDAVVVGDLSPLVARSEDVVLWRDALNGKRPGFIYNGGCILFTAGCRPDVWEDFDPATSPAAVLRSGIKMFDQAWLGMKLGPDMPVFTADDGVLSYKFDGVREHGLSGNARIVFFTGRPKPWSPEGRAIDWIRDGWR